MTDWIGYLSTDEEWDLPLQLSPDLVDVLHFWCNFIP